MNTIDIVFVRVYVSESSHVLNKIMAYLKNDAKIRGVSVFRAISGYGDSGDRSSSFLDLALDLPLAIEFFDSKDKIEPALAYLGSIVKPEHIVFWDAKGL
jgi:PII-like signaling protein